MISIAFDSQAEQERAILEYGLENIPMGIDANAQVSTEYDVLQWAVATGEPGHTFILVDEDGNIAWIQDYGAPENRGVMYVDPSELVFEIGSRLQP
jgi:hypothetical protein